MNLYNKIRFLRILWATGQIKSKWLNRLLSVYYSIRFPGYYEGKIDEVRIWEKSDLELTGAFTVEFIPDGWVRLRSGKWIHLPITSDGVYLNGKLMAKGKLKLMMTAKEIEEECRDTNSPKESVTKGGKKCWICGLKHNPKIHDNYIKGTKKLVGQSTEEVGK